MVDQIDALTEAICEGKLKLMEGNELEQTLTFPIGEEQKVLALKYKSRIHIGAIQDYLKNVKSSDSDGRVMAYISALTGVAPAVIKKMDTEDYSIAQSIAIFFL